MFVDKKSGRREKNKYLQRRQMLVQEINACKGKFMEKRREMFPQ